MQPLGNPMSRPRFGQLPPVHTYASPSETNGSKFLRMYQAQPEGIPFPWLFAHRENAKAAVHALTIVQDTNGEQFVHLLITKRPPLGGRLSIELPAGLWGDKDEAETALNAANREVREETGYTVKQSQLLSSNLFATSPGMTTEHKAFALTLAEGTPEAPEFDGEEGAIVVGKLNIPLSTFADYTQFTAWLNDMEKNNYTVGLDVIAARGLMPPLSNGRLNVTA